MSCRQKSLLKSVLTTTVDSVEHPVAYRSKSAQDKHNGEGTLAVLTALEH